MYAMILAGGSGSRLWPLSRESYPKYYLKIKQGEKESLIENTVSRLNGVVAKEDIFVVTAENQKETLSKVLGDEIRILGEPCARNTAPAVGLGAWYCSKKNSEEIMFVFPSDHYVEPLEKFQKVLVQAGKMAKKHGVVTFGIKPDAPETGYGYILCGEDLGSGVCKVQEFVEKPDLETAKKFLLDEKYLWNSGMFAFDIGFLMKKFREHLPELAKILDSIDYEKFSNLKELYEKIEPVSIDYGMMEKLDETVVIPTDIVWNDVGTWDSYYKMSKKDSNGNAFQGKVVDVDTEDSLVVSEGRVVGTVGVKDLVIIDTEDALLVCDRSRSQDVKILFEKLKEKNMKVN